MKYETENTKSQEAKTSTTKLEQEITQVSDRMAVLVGQQNQIRYSRERLLDEGTALSNSKEKLKERIGKLEQDADELETEMNGLEVKVAGYTDELSSPLTNGITREEEQMIVNLGKEVERRRKEMIELSKRKHELEGRKNGVEIELKERLQRRKEGLRLKLDGQRTI
ncbi:hypothetical protein BYT27DRAFT_6769577 [Phlegmacium glaucopus]|nr:hypothetical protein BYT27DRAFT_6769577 [Phlegmacium glaucopus]